MSLLNPMSLVLGTALALAACQSPSVSDPSLGDPVEDPDTALEDEVDPPVVDGQDLGQVDPTPDALQPARSQRRMNVEQVRDSMMQISGGIAWKQRERDRQTNWDRFSATLGVPDFQERTEEDLSPSVLFQKFLDDAASATCSAWVERATTREDRTFFAEGSIEEASADDAAVRANIVHLRRRIQGVSTSSDPDDVQAYVELYDLVLQRTGDPEAGWRTVCVGLFTHPDFYAY